MKKILFTSVPADGHFLPLTSLAVHLLRQGFDVRWYTTGKYARKLKKLGIPAFICSDAVNQSADEFVAHNPERRSIKTATGKLNFDLEHFFIRRAPAYYNDIREIHRDFPFDLLVADVAFTASVLVKELLGVPVILIGVLPLVESSRDLAPSGLGLEPARTMAGKTFHALLRVLFKKLLLRKPNRLMQRMMDYYGLPHDNLFLFDLPARKADLLLQIGTPSFEYYRSDLSATVAYIGALPPAAESYPKENWFDRRLLEFERVVLVTQGTVEKDVNKLILPTLEAFKDSNTLVVCTTGGVKTRELRTQFPHRNLIIEDFIPFADVMPFADAFVTNGGYGGVMLAIENMLPMVAAGVHEGKNEICARIGYFRYGINLKTETPRPAQIKNAVDRVTANPVYKANVEKLCQELAGYRPNDLFQKAVNRILAAEDSYRQTVIRPEELIF